MKKIVKFIYSNRKLFMISLIIVTMIAIPFLLKIGISNSLNIWFPKGDIHLKSYDNFLMKYGNDETIIVGLKAQNNFTGEKGKSELSNLLRQLDKIKGVGNTIWFGTPFISPEFRNNLISKDSLKTLIIIPMSNKSDFGDTRNRIINSITKILTKSNYEYHLAGMGVIYDGLNKATRQNGFIFVMLSFIFIFLFLIIFLRDWRILFISLLSITASTIILFSIYALIDKNINIITIVLPVLILIYGISDIVYIVYGLKSDSGNNSTIPLSQILPPCFLTSLTTAIGFFSLLVSKITAVRQIGFYGGIGVLIEFFVTLIIMIYFSDSIKKSARKPVILNSIHDLETHFTNKHYGSVIFIFTLLLIIFGYGIKYLNIDTYTIGILRGKNQVKTDSDWIEKNMGYYLPLELLVKTDNPDDEKLKMSIRAFQNAVKKRYGYNSFSYYDINIPL
ncbi:MAG: MMPL family transporter, partial [Proteobacteria bacterium]|nr:MMPL family transporter [Pseudomonadota bacterium]